MQDNPAEKQLKSGCKYTSFFSNCLNILIIIFLNVTYNTQFVTTEKVKNYKKVKNWHFYKIKIKTYK